MTALEMFEIAKQYEEADELDKAYQWYLEAALTFEDGPSIEALGDMYYEGDYVSQSYGKACNYWEIAHEKGVNIPAYCYIFMGDYREKGCDELPKDIRLAEEWYLTAAAKGEEFGYECAALMYFEGKNGSRDYDKAFEFFQKPKKKNTCALYYLGLMYEQGLGVKADPDKAMEYYQATVELVAGTGYEDLDDYCVKARKNWK